MVDGHYATIGPTQCVPFGLGCPRDVAEVLSTPRLGRHRRTAGRSPDAWLRL